MENINFAISSLCPGRHCGGLLWAGAGENYWFCCIHPGTRGEYLARGMKWSTQKVAMPWPLWYNHYKVLGRPRTLFFHIYSMISSKIYVSTEKLRQCSGIFKGFLIHLLVHVLFVGLLFSFHVQNIYPCPVGQTGPDTRRLGFATHHFFAAAQPRPARAVQTWLGLSVSPDSTKISEIDTWLSDTRGEGDHGCVYLEQSYTCHVCID